MTWIDLVFYTLLDINFFLSFSYILLVYITFKGVIFVIKNKKYQLLLFLLTIPLIILFILVNPYLYYYNKINSLNDLKSKDIKSISFYRVNYCDLSKSRKKMFSFNKEYEIQTFLDNYFKDLEFDLAYGKTWTTFKDHNADDLNSKYFDKSILEQEKQWRILLMIKIKKKNNENLYICANYSEHKSISEIVFPVDFNDSGKYNIIVISHKLKDFLKKLELRKDDDSSM